jgi:hypothetical protein
MLGPRTCPDRRGVNFEGERKRWAQFDILSKRVYTDRLANGAGMRDVSDVSEWLLQLSKKAAKAVTLDQIFE